MRVTATKLLHNKSAIASRVTVLSAGLIMFAPIPAMHAQAPIARLSEPTVITVDNPRPLARVLARIEELYHSPIDYEEVPYESPNDLAHTSVVRNGVATERVFPRGGQFSVTLSPDADPTPFLAVQSLLSEYYKAGFAGQYRIDQLSGRIEVIPVRVATAAGSQRDVGAIMSTSVSISPSTRPVAVMLNMLASELSAMSGAKIVMANEPFPDNATVELGADNEPARNVLANLADKTGVPLSYALLYDPNEKTYYLDVRAVPMDVKPGRPRQSNGPNTLPRTGQPNSPFFVKTN
ncbi:MAG TPA: hypothetical protein VMF91_00280 [Bryobacteraceae bacterium]|nr:hypothetical protein [Bryobacteraceae bacterium]